MEPVDPDTVGASLRRRLRTALPSPQPLKAVLATPNVKAVASASLVARLPRGMASLAIVLLVHRATDSYAVAGAAAGGLAIGDAVISPLQGGLIDRLGYSRVLLPSSVIYALALATLAVAAEWRWSSALIVALAGLSGMAYPPISASMKTLWPALVGTGTLLQTAYAVESLIQQTFFLLGPLLVTLIVATSSAAIAVVATGAFAFVGTVGFVASTASRASHPDFRQGAFLRALADFVVRVVVGITLAQSIVFGTLYIAIPAFTSRHGSATGAGLMLTALNVGAITGGLISAGRPTSRGPVQRYVWLSGFFVVSLTPLLLARSLLVMDLLLVVAGLFVAPTASASYVLIDLVTPRGARTEAFTWMSTAVAAGAALGAAIGGVITEYISVEATLLFAFVSCGIGAAAALAGRAALELRVVSSLESSKERNAD